MKRFLILFIILIISISFFINTSQAVVQLVTLTWTQEFLDPNIPDVNCWRIFVSYNGGQDWTYCRQVVWPGEPQSEYSGTCPVDFDLLETNKFEFRVDCVRTNGLIIPSNEVKKSCEPNAGPQPDISSTTCP